MKEVTLDQILKALAKVPPPNKEALKERNEIIKSGREIAIEPLLKNLKIKEINEWVKKVIVAIDNLIFGLLPNVLRKIPHLNTHIKYEQGETALLCLGVRQSKLWIYSGENEISNSWQKSQDSNLIRESFTRRLEILEEKVYHDNFSLIKEYLKLNRKRNLKG